MRQYVVNRLLLFVPSIILVTFLVFGMVRVIPGTIVDLMLQENASGFSAGELRHRLGVDEPIPVQYWHWVTQLAHGDLGRSLWNNQPATRQMANAMPITFELGGLGLVLAIGIGLVVGTIAATRADTP